MHCQQAYNITIPLAKYGISINEGQHFAGEVVQLFYEPALGLYPRVEKDGSVLYGGVPQVG